MVLQTAQILLGTTCGLVQVWGQFMLGVYARGSFIVGMILNCVAMLLFIGCSLVLVDAPLKPGKEARKNAYLMLLASFVGVVLSFVAVVLLDASFPLVGAVIVTYTLGMFVMLPSPVLASFKKHLGSSAQDTWSA